MAQCSAEPLDCSIVPGTGDLIPLTRSPPSFTWTTEHPALEQGLSWGNKQDPPVKSSAPGGNSNG
eukprot:1884288-Pyramimonas_sp.AAC.1